MSKNLIWVDFAERCIHVDANYLKRAGNAKTTAYRTLKKYRDDNVGFSIVAEGTVKDNYNHITVKNMMRFFERNGLTDGKKRLEFMLNCKEIDVTKGGRPYRYYNMGRIRKWFMDEYGPCYMMRQEENAEMGDCTEEGPELPKVSPFSTTDVNEGIPETKEGA